MALSQAELAALRDIETRLQAEHPAPTRARRWALAGAILAGAVVLLVVGAVVGNTAAVVLGVTWALAAPVVWWVQEHLTVETVLAARRR